MLSLLLLILGVLVLSGIFSGLEAAILSVSPSSVEVVLQKNRRFARTMQYVSLHLNRSVTTVLILNNIVNIVGSILVGQKVVLLYGSAVLGVVTTAFTFGVIIFSEIIPKSIATRYASGISRIASPFIIVMMTLFFPLIWPLERIVQTLFKGERRMGMEAQIRSLVRIGRRSNQIESDEGQLIHKVFNLNDVSARDIMVPKEDVIAIPSSFTIDVAADYAIHTPHSRYPVYDGDLDTVEGVILERDILAIKHKGGGNESIRDYLRNPLFVNDDDKADDLLVLFKDERSHLAIVREGGTTLGIVTLEDVLEELVGEIEDEEDIKKRSKLQ